MIKMHSGRALATAVLPLLLVPLAACSQGGAGASHLPDTSHSQSGALGHRRNASTQLKHIIVIIQENRSMDDLFNGFCIATSNCANTVTTDPVTGTPLRPVSLAAPYSPDHSHPGFVTAYDNGKMDGFHNVISACNGNNGQHVFCHMNVFAYVPHSETTTYFKLATVDGELSDMTFQADSGPSLPSHLYAIAGQSGGYDADHWALVDGSGVCGTTFNAHQIDMTTPYPGTIGNPQPPCKDFQTIFDELVNAGHTWRYYSNDALHSFYSVTQNIQHLYGSPNFIVPPQQFITDVGNGNLADVTFIMPEGGESDHPGWVNHPSYGPNWVASLVNAIGQSKYNYWNNSAIVVWWDDWGGWFDHVTPPRPVGEPSWMGNPDPYEYGFRVPLIVASPYAKVGSIDHETRSFVSTLRLIEETFGLPQLGTLDQYEPDGLDTMFNFSQNPLPYTPL
ncbi:MAG: hypothetical protein JO043_11615 [Candidatus Eremiobacteraeota bacterium]|nr:hypothetical protein [Candidatus Eremiobacteraeota bacterium]